MLALFRTGKEYLVLQTCREWYGDPLVWALLLEKDYTEEHTNANRRMGILSLASYNLFKFRTVKPNMWVTRETLMHPTERKGRERLLKKMKTTEWQQEK